MTEFEGALQPKNARFGIVVARFNSSITRNLLEGALEGLRRCGIEKESVDIAWVPGSLEIPLVAQKFAESGKYGAIICLGAIIRGATSHYDVVVNQSASGIMQAGLQTGIPILNAVLTTDSIEQAVERSGTKAGNKGYDVALAAVEMVDLLNKICTCK